MNKVMWLLSKRDKAAIWDTFNWKGAETELFGLQETLAAIATGGDEDGIAKTQNEIVKSFSARMLAVRHVTSSKSGPGVDRVMWRQSHEKMDAVEKLRTADYRAKPTRLVVIQPKRGKERNVKLATFFDRAMQVLYSYALTPVAEVRADRKSFGFRKYRSAMDAHCFVLKMFEVEDAPEYAVIADVKACYESISHEWLMKNVPMDKAVLREFLNAGFVFDGELFPAEEYGLSIGSGLSPILANITLDGLQSAIYKGIYRHNAIDYANGSMVRFADDMIIAARSKEEARQILQVVSSFLRKRGLTLSPTKTKIASVRDGFNFLSRNYRKIDGMMFSRPSGKAVAEFEQELTEFITTYKGSQQGLIEDLNRKLQGWAGYHRYSDANDTFRHIDAIVKGLLLDLCVSKHKRMLMENIVKKYFYREIDGEYVYAMTDKKDVRVIRLAKIPIVNHRPVSIYRNYFTDPHYFDELAKEREVHNITGKYRAVWTRQDGRCFLCGSPILADQEKEIVPINAARDCYGENMAYVHSRCAVNGADFYKTAEYIAHSGELTRLLEKLANHEVHTKDDYRFDNLKEYLWTQTKMNVTLKFSTIEEILGFKLSTRSGTINWWRRRWANGICEAGYDTGYILQNVNFKSRSVTFTRDEKAAATIKIPEVFLKGKIPADAVTELTAFFEYVRKKYGF